MMDRFSWSVALRGLLDSRRLTLLTTGVVGMSVVLVVFLTSLINGLQEKLVADVTGSIPHVTVEPEERKPVALWDRPGARGEKSGKSDRSPVYIGERTGYTQQKQKIEDWSVWLPRIRTASEHIMAATPTVRDQGFVVRGQTRKAVRIYGVRPAEYQRIVDIESSLIDGRFERLAPGEIAIGKTLADDLKIGVGDRVQVTPPEGDAVSKTIAGVYDTGFGQLDQSAVFMTLGDGQSIFGLGSAVTSIDIVLDEVFAADGVAQKLGQQLPYEVDSWTEDNEQLLRGLKAQSGSSNLIVLFATVAAAFAVASILVVLVTNKLREIGILKAIGASRKQVRRIFALQGALLSFIGATVGTIVGSVLCLGLGTIPAPNQSGRFEPLFPFDLTWGIALGAVVVATLVGLLASLIPARRAAKVEPIDVIRGA